MCTVTFIARKNGYALGMNRDEKLTRVKALPPRLHLLDGRKALFPSEPGGGTWIGVNDAGVTFALLNWYSVPARVLKDAISRGAIVRSALELEWADEVEQELAHFPLERTNPFRVIGVFPHDEAVIEWRWNLSRVQRLERPWKTGIWISSGFDEAGAQGTRNATFERAIRSSGQQNVHWLRKLHASHELVPSPYSICMHRKDAATVSYTEISVDAITARLSYFPGSLCCNAMWQHETMELSLNAAWPTVPGVP